MAPDDPKPDPRHARRPDPLDDEDGAPLELREPDPGASPQQPRKMEFNAPLRRPARADKLQRGEFDVVNDDEGPQCSHCYYSLVGMPTSGLCPECGFRYNLRDPKPRSPRHRLRDDDFFGIRGEMAVYVRIGIVCALVYGGWLYHKVLLLIGLPGGWNYSSHFVAKAIEAMVVVWAPALGFWAVELAESRRRLHPFEAVVLGTAVAAVTPVFQGPLFMIAGMVAGLLLMVLRLIKVRIKPYAPVRFRCELCEYPLDNLPLKGDCPSCMAPYDKHRAEQEQAQAPGKPRVRHVYCNKCEYELTGLPEKGHCPECGEPYNVLDPTMRLSLMQLANRRRNLRYYAAQAVSLVATVVVGNIVLWKFCELGLPSRNNPVFLTFLLIAPVLIGMFTWMGLAILTRIIGFYILRTLVVGVGFSLLLCLMSVLMISTSSLPLLLVPVSLVTGLLVGFLFSMTQLRSSR